MEKYEFTMHHLYGEEHHHITRIIEILQATSLEKDFILKFYSTIPMLNLSEEELIIHAELVRSAFNFSKKHNYTDPVLRLYQDSSKEHSVIEVFTKETPFLFDSIMCLLNRLDICIEKVAHPSIFVSRDQKGKLLSVDEQLQQGGIQESFIQIRTTNVLDKELSDQLESEINNIINLVEYAVSDWKSLLDQLQDYINDFVTRNKDIDHYQEQKEFLDNMKKNYFIFLGSVTYDFDQQNNKFIDTQVLGIAKQDLAELNDLIDRTVFIPDFFENKQDNVLIGKLNKVSVIHRDTNLDYLCLKTLDEQGNLIKATVFIGLFTSILYYQSATLIPIIKRKLQDVLERAGYSSHSYAGKELISIFEALPRDELFQMSSGELFPFVMEIYALLFKPNLRMFLRRRGDNLSCLLFLPLELVNTNNIKKIKAALSFEYGSIINYYFMQINSSKLCYYHFTINSKNYEINSIDLVQVEKELQSITTPWEDELKGLLIKEYGKTKGKQKFLEFKDSFPLSYKEDVIYSKAILSDINNISKVIETREIIFKVIPNIEGKSNTVHFKIYHLGEINLSSTMPMLQNIGFNVSAEHIYVIEPQGNRGEVWLHQFVLEASEEEHRMLHLAKENIEDAFYAMWYNKCQNDMYNQLILKANLSHRQVTLIMGMSEYLEQTKIAYSREYLRQVLNKHFKIAKQLVDLFHAMFDLKSTIEQRKQKVLEVKDGLEKSLSLIHDNVEDQIIRKFINLVSNILRTNYFVKDGDSNFKDYISFKIDSAKIMDMPLPYPYKEIFVYSANFEAIHLRGGKAARGGLRWSDRSEDYRTEVLGLMKTQIVKNAVIVPTGAKGGFVLKNTDGLGREELSSKAIECYKNFLRGMLDITDNIVDAKVRHPKNVVRYDENDTYLVVAADKGTATFSDFANQISEEYNFWLGDAFASGGSKGYDHKKMGITAKGAWISVTRHFYEMGININNTEFSVIGIGDMSGDVFGNGMLLSNNIRLVAAFNHMHIFIDPNPDSKKSFTERKRLFDLPRSTWEDYNPEILSKGAQIYSRKDKSLLLTPEIKELLNLNVDSINPNDLIKALLTAEVDLLWNGGIGTYIKASFETNEQVGDKTNDNLRCNGEDLRCKIIGEGGNLGLTQHGRIEYAKIGGKINTDAIDNSAGVDCSDHEVNIKIVLKQAISSGLITEKERVELLESMTEDVMDLVLKDNRTQTRALVITDHQGYEILAEEEEFIDLLEEQGILDRKLECLPSKQKFIELHAAKQYLTRPELSVVLSYSKNAIYNELIETNIPDDEYFCNDLLLYFPEAMRNKFADIIKSHPLRREIVATAITNSMVNRIYTFYLHRTVASTGHKFCDIARAYTITRDIFGLRTLWKEMSILDGVVPIKDQVKLYIVIKKFMVRSTSWLLRNHQRKLDITSVIEEYKIKIDELIDNIDDYLSGSLRISYEKDLKDFINLNVPEDMARRIALLGPLSSAYNIVDVSNKYKTSIKQVSEIYFELGQRFSIYWLRECANNIVSDSSWQKLALRGFKDELYDIHRKITASAIEYTERHEDGLDRWYHQNDKHIKLFDRFILEVKGQASIEYSMIDLSLKKMSLLLSK